VTSEKKQIEQIVRQQSPTLLNNLSNEKKNQFLNFLQRQPLAQLATQIVHQQITTTGPVPPAELLAGYNRELPDGANRLFTLVENQSAHRQFIEKQIIQTQNTVTTRGQWIACFLVILLTAVGGYFGYMGHEALAGTIFATTIVAVATVFIVGKKTQTRDLDQKAKALAR
jgi:uncharacterized membrane protein